jgi:hypothetical protein
MTTSNSITGGFVLPDPNGTTMAIGSIPISYQYGIQFQDSVGISYGIQSPQQPTAQKRVGPRLYFSYIKSKLTKLETKRLKARLHKLQGLLKNAEEANQQALYEQLSKMLIIAVRESEALACGYGTHVHLEHINKFKSYVKETDSASVNPVEFKILSEFPRSIPDTVQQVVKKVQKKGLFEELWVLYLDYTKEPIKSNKEKIREKDPILFGRMACDPDKFYFIADWIDEYCDLTLSEFVDTLKKSDEEYKLNSVEELTPEYLERLKNEIKEREERLQATRPNNYREMMEKEEKVKTERALKDAEELRGKLAMEEVARAHAEDRLKLLEDAKREQAIKETAKPWYKKIF